MRLIQTIPVLVSLGLSGSVLASPIPKPEHPRPDFRRDTWMNLNGTWEFAFDPDDRGLQDQWFLPESGTFDRRILVPFPWESKLSGICDPTYNGVAWYRRAVTVPRGWQGQRIWLCFGAVDWRATVWVNGRKAGEHEGGYTPFRFDVTDLLNWEGENVLVVRAEDWTSREQPVGKQVGWYTKTSGIWQTVYLEAVPSRISVQKAHVLPQIEPSQATVRIRVRNDEPGPVDALVRLSFADTAVGPIEKRVRLQPGETEVALVAAIPNPRPWYPEDPYLYEFTVEILAGERLLDRVHSYFGLREVRVAPSPGSGYPMIWINDRPVYIRGALNQAFNPDGVYTYPSDDYARQDIERGLAVGFNMFRIHIKADEPRLLYWADRLGMLLQCDMPCFLDYTDVARRRWESTMREVIERDFNHPSIFSWCLFNETWGLGMKNGYTPDRQEWVRSMVHLAKQLDPTRLIEDNSPCFYDHVETDLNTWHFYINDYWIAKEHIRTLVDSTFPGSGFNFAGRNRQGSQPLLNSEYGGISAGSGDRDISWCFRFLTNELRLHRKIVGYVYTEYQDIEWEHNGFFDYDRRPKDFGYSGLWPGFRVQDLNRADFLVIDSPPCRTTGPGETLEARILASCMSGRAPTRAKLRWALFFTNHLGGERLISTGERSVEIRPYDVSELGVVRVRLPNEPGLAVLRTWVEDYRRTVWARNFVTAEIWKPPKRVHRIEKGIIALHFSPGEYAEADWDSLLIPEKAQGEKIAGLGTGYFEYQLTFPRQIKPTRIHGISLLFEGASRAGLAKVDARFPDVPWSRKKPSDYPQTDATKWPTDVTVWINDVPVKTVHFPDDPADARGVLSHHAGVDPGSYGYLTEVRLTGEKLKRVLTRLARSRSLRVRFEVSDGAPHRGGFSLYGARMGRYPVPPTVLLYFR